MPFIRSCIGRGTVFTKDSSDRRFSLCLGDSLHLQSFDNSLYNWGSHLTSNEIKTLPTISQSILVWKYDEDNCYNEQIVEIEVFDTNSVDLIKPSVICENEDFILDINVNGPRLSKMDWKIEVNPLIQIRLIFN